MSAKSQHNNILLAVGGFILVVIIVALIGFLALDRDPDIIQGQVEVTEYRVSSKVPGRILELRVSEGDFVKAGDTLAILDAPEVRAKMEQARSAESAAAALELKAQNGARKEQIQGAFSSRAAAALSALRACSIFARTSGASRMARVSPAFTKSPSLTRSSRIRPGTLLDTRYSDTSTCPCMMSGSRSRAKKPINATIITTATNPTTASRMLLC